LSPPDHLSGKTSASGAECMEFKSWSDQNFLHIANDSPLLQPCSIKLGAKRWRWASFTHDTWKGLRV